MSTASNPSIAELPPGTPVRILDPYRVKTIAGRLVKNYPLGLTIDDARGVRHYATYDRYIGAMETRYVTARRDGRLF